MSRRRARLSAAATWARVSFAGPGRVRRLAQQFQHVGGVQVLERLQRGGEVLAQLVPQPLHRAGAVPDQRLVRPGHHLDALAFRGVPRSRAQLVGVGADHVREHVRVAAVALGARYAVPFPVPGRLQRVHREHRVPGRDQRRNPRAPVGLDPGYDLRVIGVLRQETADQLMHLGHPGRALGQPPLRQHLPGLVHHLDVVMILRPVITHEQPHPASPVNDIEFRQQPAGEQSAT